MASLAGVGTQQHRSREVIAHQILTQGPQNLILCKQMDDPIHHIIPHITFVKQTRNTKHAVHDDSKTNTPLDHFSQQLKSLRSQQACFASTQGGAVADTTGLDPLTWHLSKKYHGHHRL
jgi:hypothetical protein